MDICRKCPLIFPFTREIHGVYMKVHKNERAYINPLFSTFTDLYKYTCNFTLHLGLCWVLIMTLSLMELTFHTGADVCQMTTLMFVSRNCHKCFESKSSSAMNLQRKMANSEKRWSHQSVLHEEETNITKICHQENLMVQAFQLHSKSSLTLKKLQMSFYNSKLESVAVRLALC